MVFEDLEGFQFEDYVIFVVIVVASLCIGVYYATCQKNKTTGQYLIAERQMGTLPIGLSIMISYVSAISILGNSAEMYYYGINFCFAVIGYVAAAVCVSVLFVPLYYPLQLTSIDQYFFLRYKSRCLVYIGLTLQIFFLLLSNAVVLYGPATMMESMAGWPVWSTMLGLGLLSTIYTTMGGFRAVIWSDVFQTIIIFGGVLAVVILGTIKVGSVSEVWRIYSTHDRLRLNLNLSPLERSTIWGFGLGFFFNFAVNFGVTQIGVQRYCAVPTLSAAKKALLVTVPGIIAIQLTILAVGITAFAYFTKLGCDPLTGGFISNKNQIVPFYVLNVLHYPAVPGVFVAAVFCGCLSNLSSFYSSMAALVWEDVLRDKLVTMHEERKAVITKILSFVAGVLSIAGGFIVASIGGTLIKVVLSLTSITNSPYVVFVLCGALSRRPNYKCVLIGGIVAFVLTAWFNIGHQLYNIAAPIKSTVTHNCTSPDVFVNDFIYANTTDTFTTDPVSTEREVEEPLLIYRITYVWYLPFGVLAGVITTFALSLIPYFREEDEDKIGEEVLFTFVRFFLQKRNTNVFDKNSRWRAETSIEDVEIVRLANDNDADLRPDPGTWGEGMEPHGSRLKAELYLAPEETPLNHCP